MTADPIVVRAAAADEAGADPLVDIDADARDALSAVADHLIPAGHGMPSAGTVVGDARLRFVLVARSDLVEPLLRALRPGVGDGTAIGRLAALVTEPDALGALYQVVVFAYYTDRDVRDRLGYPGQMAKTLYSWKVPDFIAEGLTDQVLARGPIWRDPATGRRAKVPASATTASSPEPPVGDTSPDRRGEPS